MTECVYCPLSLLNDFYEKIIFIGGLSDDDGCCAGC